jgi:hypothetical protein
MNAAAPSAPPAIRGDGSRRGETILLPGQTPEGAHILAVLLKRTYDIHPGKPCVRAEKDRRLIAGDQPYGDPMNSSIRFESDFVPFKLATDVVANATAYAPGGRPTGAMDVSLTVGGFKKDLRIFGDRKCRFREKADPVVGDPQPFTSMELRYERAYGGVDIHSEPKVPYAYPRNYMGKGFAVTSSRGSIDELALPNIEDPADLLTPPRIATGDFKRWEKQPTPQGLGWYGKSWQPRASLAGVMPADRATEQELRKAYAQLLSPAEKALYEGTALPDMNFRFFNGASPGLSLPFLASNVRLRAVGLTRDGDLTFDLPGETPQIGLDVGRGAEQPPVVPQTIMIRMEDRQIDIVWRAAFSYPGPEWLPEMRKCEISVR